MYVDGTGSSEYEILQSGKINGELIFATCPHLLSPHQATLPKLLIKMSWKECDQTSLTLF